MPQRVRRNRTSPKPTRSRQERIDELKDQFNDAVQQLTNTDQWRSMLRGALHLHRYSFRNIMLILQQCENATQVAGIREWNKRGRRVKKGEHALWILAPMTVLDRNSEKEAGGAEPDESEKDGERRRVLFKPVRVFDISQTVREDGQPDPAPVAVQNLIGAAPGTMWDDLTRYAESVGYSVERGDTRPADGATDPGTHTVRICDLAEDAHAALTLAHEVAHIVCGHVDDPAEYRKHRGRMETEAEAVAYIVSASYGLDSTVNSVPYAASWAGETAEEVRATLQATGEAVVTAARTVLDAVARQAEHEDVAAA